MSDDCIHNVQLCPTCGGLLAQKMERLQGVTSVEMTGHSPFKFDGPVKVYVGPAFGPCSLEEEQAG